MSGKNLDPQPGSEGSLRERRRHQQRKVICGRRHLRGGVDPQSGVRGKELPLVRVVPQHAHRRHKLQSIRVSLKVLVYEALSN